MIAKVVILGYFQYNSFEEKRTEKKCLINSSASFGGFLKLPAMRVRYLLLFSVTRSKGFKGINRRGEVYF